MIVKNKIFKSIATWLGAVGISLTAFTTLSSQAVTTSTTCTGSCGSCGFGCSAPLLGIVGIGIVFGIARKLKNIALFFVSKLQKFKSLIIKKTAG